MTECLARILSPRTPGWFADHSQARKYFHIERASPGYYAHLLTVADIDRILQSGYLPAGSINVVQDGIVVPVEEWSSIETGARDTQRVATSEKLLRLYARGATLILNRVQHAVQTLNETCRSLAQELGFPAQANIYITPRNSIGFRKHADGHEVLILQIAGSKTWVLFPPDSAEVQISLQSGDLLYVPRGVFHAARSGEEDSIHITLGLHPAYGFDLIRSLADLAMETDGFQVPAPPLFAGPAAMQAFETDFRARLQALLKELPPLALTELRHEDLRRNQSQRWPGRFADLRHVHQMDLNTIVCRRPGVLTRVRVEGTRLHVEIADEQVTIPVFLRDGLQLVLGDSSFAIGEVGGMITAQGKVTLIAEFVNAGLLQIVTI